MRALILQPHELADPGLVGETLTERGVALQTHVLADQGPPPPLEDFDALVVMGAPWSVDDDEVAPWIDGLTQRIRDAADAQVPVLGICFGAQAHALAMGGAVERAIDKEVGLHDVYTEDAAAVPAGPWFMWHGDAFVPPAGADVIARTPAGPQAYRYGRDLLVQFHPEATAEIVERWLAYDDADFRALDVDPDATVSALRDGRGAAAARAAVLVGHFLGS